MSDAHSDSDSYEIRRERALEFFDRELASFVPERVFDAHLEIWPPGWASKGELYCLQREPTDLASLHEEFEVLHPGRLAGAILIPFSFEAEDLAAANALSGEIAAQGGPTYRTLLFVRPGDDPEWVRQEGRRLGAVGLKGYYTFADLPDAAMRAQADIPAYMPEALVRVAHEEGWLINMHLVKTRAVAHPENRRWIRHYCSTYPDMKLVLSHAARGFQPANNLAGLADLTDLPNLYFDSSVNCESFALEAVIRVAGHARLLYGSDFIASHQYGRSVAVGDSFIWIHDTSPVWGEGASAVQPTLVGLEHLRALKWACWSQGLTDSQVEDIFYGNAAALLGV